MTQKQHILSDKELITGCLDGKEKYFKILYEQYYGKMLNVCKRYARNQEEAKDVLQDGFMKVFKSISKFDFNGSFEGWIRRIIVNNAINQYKQDSKSITQYIDNEDFSLVNLTNDELVEDVYIEPEILLNLVNELPPAYKLVFNLSVVEGYAHKEIAEMLNINEGTSRSNLAKARLKLQEKVKQVLNQNQMLSHV